MTRLWDEELRAGSHILRLETMDRLGGAERIVRTHLDAVMSTLLPNEQEIAASVFHYLVTPSGTKIAHTISDLAEYAQLPQMQLSLVLEKLCRGDVRILRPVAPPPDQPDKPRYEIFHDVLALAILDWRARHVQEQERAAAAKREAARQHELEQAQTLAREQERRAEEQARIAGRLRRLAGGAGGGVSAGGGSLFACLDELASCCYSGGGSREGEGGGGSCTKGSRSRT